MTPTMICTHCGSNDIVAVQGEYFCVNCGQTMAAPKIKQVKRGPGRPKATRLDEPKITTTVIPDESTVKSIDETKPGPVPETVPTPIEPAAAPVVVMDTITPRNAKPKEPEPKKARPKVLLAWGKIIGASLQAFTPLHVLLVLPGIVMLLGGIGSGLLIRRDPLWAGIALAAWTICGLLWLGLARTAIMISASATDNHRPKPLRASWAIAHEYGLRLVPVRVLLLIEEIVVVGLAGCAIYAGRYAADWPYDTQIIAIFVVEYILIMTALIRWVHHSLFEAAIIQGDLSYKKAFTVLQKLPTARLDIVGSKALNVAVWTAIAGVLAFITNRYVPYGSEHNRLLITSIAAGLVGATAYVVTTAALSGELYRQLVIEVLGTEATALTATAHSTKVSKAKRLSTMLSVVVPFLVAIGAMVELALHLT